MSLNSLEAAILQLVVEAFEDCDLETPDSATRHHGPHPVMPGCCTEPGVLSIYVDDIATPASCNPPKWTLAIKWSTCWPDEINPLNLAARDVTTTRINDVMECVLAAFTREVCKWGATSSLFAHASTFALGRTSTFGPDGKCAGVVWRTVVTVRRPEAPAS